MGGVGKVKRVWGGSNKVGKRVWGRRNKVGKRVWEGVKGLCTKLMSLRVKAGLGFEVDHLFVHLPHRLVVV